MTGQSNNLPPGWVEAKLEDFTEIVLGQSPPSATYNDSGDGLPFYQGKTEFGILYPSPNKWCTEPHKIAQSNDVLISVRAPVGPTNLCPDKSCIGRGLAAIRRQGNISHMLILYLLRTYEREISSQSTGTTFGAITGDKLKNFVFPLPPLAEQQRIVLKIEELLTKLDAGVEELHKVKAQLKRYRQAVLKAAFEGKLTQEWREKHKNEVEPASSILARIKAQQKQSGKNIKRVELDSSQLPELPYGWEWSRLDEITKIVGGITVDNKRLVVKGRPIPYLRVANVQRGYIDLSEVKTIITDEETAANLALKSGDILFTEGGDRDKLGRGWVWNAELPECIHQNHIFRARLLDIQLSPKLISWFCNTFGREYFTREGKQTTNLASINMTKLSALPISLPPIEEQKVILNEVDRCFSIVDELEKTVETNIKEAERMRQSILKSAFEGKLVAQDPNDEPAAKLIERIKAAKTKEGTIGRRTHAK